MWQLLGWIHLPNILKYRVYYIFSVCQLYHHKDIFKKRAWDNSKIFSTSESVLVAQSCSPLFDPIDCSKPGSSVHRILLARILEWIAISFSRRSPKEKKKKWIWMNLLLFLWRKHKCIQVSCCQLEKLYESNEDGTEWIPKKSAGTSALEC